MFAGEPAGIPHTGTREAIRSATRASAKAAWENLVRSAAVCQFSIGDGADARFSGRLAEKLGARTVLPTETRPHPAPSRVNRVTEEMPLAQSKLVMGMHVGTTPAQRLVTRLTAAIFGGTPSSKLFLSVREKQSLCYYCSAQYDTPKNVIFVQSGVETANLERAEEAILTELRAMQAGEISDEEILHAKLALCNSYHSVADSAASMESWYLSCMLQNNVRAPEEDAAAVMKITKDEIVEAANRIALDTVYRLKGDAKAE